MALLASFLLLASASSLPAAAQNAGAGTNSLLTFIVYPDGSVGASFDATQTSTTQAGTVPTVDVQGAITSQAGVSTSTVNGTVSIPSSLLSQASYSSSETFTASGSYANGKSQGSVHVQAVAGVSSPLSSFVLSYRGTATDFKLNGSATVQYGTYVFGSTRIVLNATYIAQLVAAMQSSFFSTSYLNSYVKLLPYANLSVASATLTAQIGVTSATLNGNFEMQGNITAFPASLEAYAFCSSSQFTPAQCKGFFNLYGTSFASIQSYNYNVSYSSGILGFTMSSTSKSVASYSSLLKAEAQITPNTGLTASQQAFLNTTTINFSGFQYKVKVTQAASGEEEATIDASGLTVTPKVVVSGGSFTESALFHFLASAKANVTLVGGASSGGSVTISVPSGAPTATSSTTHSASWTNVNMSALASVQFVVSSTASASSFAASNVVIANGAVSVDETSQTGVTVSLSGLGDVSGRITVITQQLKGPSQGESAPSGGTAQYFDVFVAPPPGSSFPTGAQAKVCVQASGATSSTTMVYWSGTSWVSATGTAVTGTTVCGTIPASALGGTNVATVTASGGGGIPEFPISIIGAALLTFAILGAYLFTRRRQLLPPRAGF